MVKTSLVSSDLEFGNATLAALDAAHFPVTVAFWQYSEDDGDWTLVLGTPLYEKFGAKEAYLRLIAALSTKKPIALSELPLRLEGNRSPLIKGLRKLFGKAASVEGMRLGGHSVGGVWVDDAYIYRIG